MFYSLETDRSRSERNTTFEADRKQLRSRSTRMIIQNRTMEKGPRPCECSRRMVVSNPFSKVLRLQTELFIVWLLVSKSFVWSIYVDKLVDCIVWTKVMRRLWIVWRREHASSNDDLTVRRNRYRMKCGRSLAGKGILFGLFLRFRSQKQFVFSD